MKKCPNCQATFDDNMRFCQTDGTPLVDEAPVVETEEPAFDPYATIVGTVAPPPVKAAAEEPVAEEPAAEEAVIHQTVSSIPIAPPDDVLDLPENDPLKTMYVSESEMQDAMRPSSPDVEIVEIPPIESTPAPEPPSFIAQDQVGFGAPPPSPFSSPTADEPVAAPEIFAEQPQRSFDEAATVIQSPPTFDAPPPPAYEPTPSPFDTPNAAPVAEWTPPPAPDSGWANQQIGSNTPFQPPPPGVAGSGENKTLAIGSMVAGIISVLCCSSIFVVGIAAIVTGFMARSKAASDPDQYGGSGFALAGIITGGVSLLFGAIYWLLVIFQVVALPNM